MPDEERDRLQREAFLAGYVESCRQWTSGCVPALTFAYKAYALWRDRVTPRALNEKK